MTIDLEEFVKGMKSAINRMVAHGGVPHKIFIPYNSKLKIDNIEVVFDKYVSGKIFLMPETKDENLEIKE